MSQPMHFLDLDHYSSADLLALLDYAALLKREWSSGGNSPILRGKALAMIFQKPSLRTRVSFEMAMQHLGGHALYLGPNEVDLGKRESPADVARVLSGYVQAIMARVFSHQDLMDLAVCSTIPVINGLSDYSHPCQTLADLLTIREHFGHLEGLRIAYVGDANNVLRSLVIGAALCGMSMVVASPPEYSPDAALIEAGADRGLTLTVTTDPREAVHDADILYTDTWVSMGQEAEAAIRLPIFQPYQVNGELLQAAPSHAVVMHDLPAYRGREITAEVIDGPRAIVFPQAHNRLHAQKAILARLLAPYRR